jgi:ferredoxin
MALTKRTSFPTLRTMSNRFRKSIALILLLWLPLFSASAVAESLAMQLQRGECHEAAEMMVMSHDDMMDHEMMDHGMMHHGTMQTHDSDDGSCTSCGICHIACSAFLGAPAVAVQSMASSSQPVAFIPEHFISHLSAPLDPPPLVAA